MISYWELYKDHKMKQKKKKKKKIDVTTNKIKKKTIQKN
jgi:hypothetical protein